MNVYCDKSAISVAKCPVLDDRTRDMEVDKHLVEKKDRNWTDLHTL